MNCDYKQFGTFQIRRGSASLFSSSNIILASGEPAYAIDTKVFKIGDGITPWNSLTSPLGIGSNSNGGGVSISNSGNNRILTSTGSTSGIYAESDLTFDTNTSVLNIGNLNDGNLHLNFSTSDGQSAIKFINDGIDTLNIRSYSDGRENIIRSIDYPLTLASSGMTIESYDGIILSNKSPSPPQNLLLDDGYLYQDNGSFLAFKDAAKLTYISRVSTSGSDSSQLFLNGSNTTITIPAKTTYTFISTISAYNNTDNTAAGWIFKGVIKRDNTNTTSLVGNVIEENWKDTLMSSGSVVVTANNATSSLQITVSGISNKVIRWCAVTDLSKVSFEGL